MKIFGVVAGNDGEVAVDSGMHCIRVDSGGFFPVVPFRSYPMKGRLNIYG